jgi:hypothetical protein
MHDSARNQASLLSNGLHAPIEYQYFNNRLTQFLTQCAPALSWI